MPKLPIAISSLFTMMTGGNTRNTRSGSINESNMDELRQFIKDYFKNEFLDEIKAVVRQQTEASIKDLVTDPMARLEQQLAQMNDLVTKVSAVETAMQFTSKRMDEFGKKKVALPALASHVAQVASALALQTLDIDVHRRKCSLTVRGLKGDADEDDADTRRVCVQQARQDLDIEDAAGADFAACHRLSHKKDAGIILRFRDLSQRNKWLLGARKLTNLQDNISICPDLPPVPRPLKTELLQKRKSLPQEKKKNSHIKYWRQWPYVELTIPNSPKVRPSHQVSDIVSNVLGINPLCVFPEPPKCNSCAV